MTTTENIAYRIGLSDSCKGIKDNFGRSQNLLSTLAWNFFRYNSGQTKKMDECWAEMMNVCFHIVSGAMGSHLGRYHV